MSGTGTSLILLIFSILSVETFAKSTSKKANVVLSDSCAKAEFNFTGNDCPGRIKLRVFNINEHCSVKYDIPWQVALVLKKPAGKHFCGGTLINERFVLTAAHCVNDTELDGETVPMKPEYMAVVFGEKNLLEDEGTEVKVDISDIIMHEDYQSVEKGHDIALLRLKDKVQTNEHIKIACLPTEEPTSDQIALTSGWGRKLDGQYSTKLLQVALPIMEREKCADIYKNYYANEIITEGQICLESEKHFGTCHADSGGGAVIDDNGKVTVVGINSFGVTSLIIGPNGLIPYCNTEFPEVFTNVAEYVPWIMEKMNEFP